ncbi:MAG: TolC family protein [Kiritimatiellae bacterium]|nr:TolC family protein [Kiritimatiellia bacterium]
MKIKLQHGIVAAALAAAGCSLLPSVGPDYSQPEIELPAFDLPDAGAPTTNLTATGEYRAADAEADARALITTNDVASWWLRFDDPILADLVECAVSNNVSYLMAQERLTASRWQLLGSYAAYYPHITASLSGQRTEYGRQTPTMVDRGTKLHRDVFAGGFDATWEIDIFGGSRRATEAAAATVESMDWSVADAWVSLTSEVGARYIELRTTQRRLEVARTNLVLQSETYDILKSRLDSGIGDELAVNQSKYVVDQTRAAIPPLVAQEEQLKNALAILTGGMPGTLHAVLAPVADRDWLLEPGRLEAVPLDMIRARPDVRAAERAIAAQCAYVGVAESMWYPKLYITGALGLQSTHPQNLFDRASLYGAIGPAVSWPIFQGGNIYASIKTEEAKMTEKILAYELALEKAYGEVRDAYANYTQEYHRYQALEGAVAAAQDAVAIAKDLYKNGLRDFTAVIDAQRSLLSLEEALVVSRGTITLNVITLYKALGGGLL